LALAGSMQPFQVRNLNFSVSPEQHKATEKLLMEQAIADLRDNPTIAAASLGNKQLLITNLTIAPGATTKSPPNWLEPPWPWRQRRQWRLRPGSHKSASRYPEPPWRSSPTTDHHPAASILTLRLRCHLYSSWLQKRKTGNGSRIQRSFAGTWAVLNTFLTTGTLSIAQTHTPSAKTSTRSRRLVNSPKLRLENSQLRKLATGRSPRPARSWS